MTATEGFFDLRPARWLEAWAALGSPEQARRVHRAVAAGHPEPWALPQLSRALRASLRAAPPRVELPAVARRWATADGAEKLLCALPGDQAVEAVLIPAARSLASREHMQARLAPDARRPLARRPARATGCLSTQVGCAVGCTFCASGRLGLARNLTAGQIVGQALRLREAARARGLHLGQLVVMGMGEPFHNTDALLVALEHLTAPDGLAIGPGHVTVSTVGVPAGLERLAAEGPHVHLALSLHAPDDATRAAIVPLARRLPPVDDLLALAARYARATRREVTVSYVLLEGVNDDPAQARDLAAKVRAHGLRHVNLIPWNEVPDLPHRASSPARVDAFFGVLRAAGVPTHIRRARGLEAEAACGQLARRGLPTR